MITHRVSTKVSPEPPVRFYRTIALSFLAITLILLGVVIYFTSKKATIVVLAKAANKNISTAITVDGLAAAKPTAPGIVGGTITSTLFRLSQKYFPSGNKHVSAVATGEVVLYNETPAEQPLVATTRLLTPNGVLFRLSDRVVVPAQGKVTAQVYADQLGESGNIRPSKFTIPGLSAEKQKVIYAESTKAMTGGVKNVGVLSEEDIREARADYTERVKQTYLTQVLNNDSQYLVLVADHAAVVDRAVGDEVSEFTLTGTSTVIVVTYDKNALKPVLEQEVETKIDTAAEKILSNKEPQVAITSYDPARNQAQLTATVDVLVTLDANSKALAPTNFFGKSKQEIERYISKFNHVVGADVKFSPSWMRTAPAVADRIKVIVKNVE